MWLDERKERGRERGREKKLNKPNQFYNINQYEWLICNCFVSTKFGYVFF